jgi:hypothetical protein
MADYMKTKKMLFELQKPFSKSFKDGTRSVWLLSHHENHDNIKMIIK